MADSDDIVNEILRASRPGFQRAKEKTASDTPEPRATAQAQSPDLSYLLRKVEGHGRASDAGASPDVADVIVRAMGGGQTADTIQAPHETQIVKIENDAGEKTRGVFDITGKIQIGGAS
jgi:hypothetical protein